MKKLLELDAAGRALAANDSRIFTAQKKAIAELEKKLSDIEAKVNALSEQDSSKRKLLVESAFARNKPKKS